MTDAHSRYLSGAMPPGTHYLDVLDQTLRENHIQKAAPSEPNPIDPRAVVRDADVGYVPRASATPPQVPTETPTHRPTDTPTPRPTEDRIGTNTCLASLHA